MAYSKNDINLKILDMDLNSIPPKSTFYYDIKNLVQVFPELNSVKGEVDLFDKNAILKRWLDYNMNKLYLYDSLELKMPGSPLTFSLSFTDEYSNCNKITKTVDINFMYVGSTTVFKKQGEFYANTTCGQMKYNF